jgi:hypothetical protein
VRTGAVRRAVVAVLSVAAAGRLGAQAGTDSTRCDSIIRAAVVDTVPSAIFLLVEQLDGARMTDQQLDLITSRIAGHFTPPKPFRLSVFDGPSLTRALRVSAPGDSAGVPRETSVVGAYRLDVGEHGLSDGPSVARSSLLLGFDAAVVRAIRDAVYVRLGFRPPAGELWELQVRVSSDSVDGARRIAQGAFPRMRVRDASPAAMEPLVFPEEARADSVDRGVAVLQFVVDRDGRAAIETVQVVRTTGRAFAKAALIALASQRFNPAMIGGCPVAQLVEFPYMFDAASRSPPRSR